MKRFSQLMAVVCISSIATTIAVAQEDTQRTIKVTGVGTASASPDFVVLRGSIAGSAESAEKAHDKYLVAREKVTKEFDNRKVDKVSLEFGGERVVDAYALQEAGFMDPFGGLEDAAEDMIAVAESVTIKVQIENDMERMQIAKKIVALVDKARKAGVEFSAYSDLAMYDVQLTMAQFVISDPSELRLQAYEAAVKEARTRAERLAQLAEGKVGKVLAIEAVDTELEDPYGDIYYGEFGVGFSDTDEQLTTERNGTIELRQKVRMAFQLLDE